MILAELAKLIGCGNIPKYIVLFGEEQKIVDIYIDKLCENFKKIILNSVQDAVSKVRVKSLDKSRKAYVVSADSDYLNKENIWKTVAAEFEKSNSILILRYSKLDKRGKFYKNNPCVDFPRLSPEVLTNYILKDLDNLSVENAHKLIDYCNSDYGRILMEIDKIKQFSDSGQEQKYDIAFSALDKEGLFYKEIGDITFELTDAVLGGYTDIALEKLDEAHRKGEPVVMIASILYRGFRNLLAYQGLGKNKQDAMRRTGLTKGEIYGCNKQAGGYTLAEIKRNMLFCQDVECGIKMGRIDSEIALDYLILTCLH